MRVDAARFFQARNQAHKRGSLLGMLSVMLACLTGVLPAASHAQATGEVRYVWAGTLPLCSAPDGKEMARLPYGTKVVLLSDAAAPVPHREIMAALQADGEHPKADVVLEGHWIRAEALGKRGWVFDGYLSRYRAPGEQTDSPAYGDEELAYAAQVFGVAHAWEWKKGDAKEGKFYQAMRRRWKLDDDADLNDIYWTRVEFQHGGKAEMARIVGEGSSENLALEGMPLTFNEALLWWRHFHFSNEPGTFEAGHRLQVDPAHDGCGDSDRVSVICGKKTCDIVSGAEE